MYGWDFSADLLEGYLNVYLKFDLNVDLNF